MKPGNLAFARLLITGALLLGCKEEKASAPVPIPSGSIIPGHLTNSAPSVVDARGAGHPSLTPPVEPRNVILITIDSLRADMPWTGYPRPIAPWLTKLAEKSAVYSNAYSGSSYTAKSVATLLSGRYPSTLYRSGTFFAKYASANVMFPELLAARNIRSIGMHAHLYFARGKGLEQGFAEWELVPGIRFDSDTDKNVTSEKMTGLALSLLGKPENTSGQFFAWAHYMDPHDEYLKHKEAPDFGGKNRDRYDSEVWHTDYWLHELLTWAEAQPWWKRTVLIISADHGESFGEHGMYKHAFELWENLTRVPLIVHGPGVVPRTIDERRSHIDLAPTILELMGSPIPEGFQGRSLVPELRGAPPDNREPILLELAEDSNNPFRRAIIQGDLKLIERGRKRYELYDLARDPGELKDLAKSRPEALARMKEVLEERYKTLPFIEPYGGTTLKDGSKALGPSGPPAGN